ncbi:MAG: caspase family protein [Desulfococcaceae bacterium]
MMNQTVSKEKNRFSQVILQVFLMSMLILCISSCLKKEPAPQTDPATTGSVSPAPVQPAPAPVKPTVPSAPVYTPPQSDSSSVPVLRLIIVADTNDSKIGRSVAADSQNMQSLMEDIVSLSNGELVLKKIVLTGDSATRHNMLRAIEYPKVKSTDVIVFLYAGHGHRDQNTSTRWPLLDPMDGTADFAEVIAKIKGKNPRQFIALADCCNEVVARAEARVLQRRQFTYNQIRQMFLTSQTYIAASGSAPGQFSYGDDSGGGLFTAAFVSSLSSVLSSSQPDWNQVFEKTVATVRQQSGGEQIPQYEKFR